MPELEPGPLQGALEPAQPRALTSSDLIRRVASDLTPYQAMRVGRTIARRRMKTAVALARLEDETLEAEARVIAGAKVRSTEEQAERLLHAERADCLTQAALRHEEASRLIDLVQDEVAHDLFKGALKGASAQYVSGVVRRSSGQ